MELSYQRRLLFEMPYTISNLIPGLSMPIAELHQGGIFCTAEDVPNPAAPLKKKAKKKKK